jgi:hypothetical protein
LLVSKGPSHTLRPHGIKRQTAYTLRLPLQSPKTASAAILTAADKDLREAEENGNEEYIEIIVEPADMSQIEESFWNQLVALVDWDSSGTLDKEVRCQNSRLIPLCYDLSISVLM